jgi:hypothetical protein
MQYRYHACVTGCYPAVLLALPESGWPTLVLSSAHIEPLHSAAPALPSIVCGHAAAQKLPTFCEPPLGLIPTCVTTI